MSGRLTRWSECVCVCVSEWGACLHMTEGSPVTVKQAGALEGGGVARGWGGRRVACHGVGQDALRGG